MLRVGLRKRTGCTSSSFNSSACSARNRHYFHNREGKCLRDSIEAKYMLRARTNNLSRQPSIIFSFLSKNYTYFFPPWLFKRDSDPEPGFELLRVGPVPRGCLWAAMRGGKFLRGGESPWPCRIHLNKEQLCIPRRGDPRT